MFPPVNDSTQVKLGAQQLDAIETGENFGCVRSGKKRECSPIKVKWQTGKARSRIRVNLNLAFTRFGALKGMKSDAGLACFLLDR